MTRRSTDTIAVPDPDASRALRFLRDHFRRPIRVQTLAAELDGSLRRTQAVFREHVGRTMFEELMRLRIDHAKALLRDRKLKMEAVALESGFANRYSFARAFHRATGLLPKAYRKDLLRAASV